MSMTIRELFYQGMGGETSHSGWVGGDRREVCLFVINHYQQAASHRLSLFLLILCNVRYLTDV